MDLLCFECVSAVDSAQEKNRDLNSKKTYVNGLLTYSSLLSLLYSSLPALHTICALQPILLSILLFLLTIPFYSTEQK